MASVGLGLAAVTAGLAANISVNDNVAIFNVGALFSGGLQLLGAIITLTGSIPSGSSSRKTKLLIGYSSVVGFLVAVSTLVLLGMSPVFFTTAPTLTRQWVIGTAILFFAVSSIIFAWQYIKLRSQIVYYYALALALIAIGLLGTAMYKTPNALFNWTARLAQYLSGFYFLVGVLSVRKAAKFATLEPVGLSQGWTDAFSSDRKQLDVLFGKISEGFAYNRIVCDSKGKPVDYVLLGVNDKFAQITGLSKDDIVGKTGTSVLPDVEKDVADWIGIYGRVALTEKPARFESYVKSSDRWYSISAYSPKKGYFVTLVEDITERKKAEEALRRSETNLEMKNRQLMEMQTQLVKAERLAAIGELAGMVGHDLRNPLMSITGAEYYLKITLESQLQDKQIEMLKIIEEDVAYSNKIVNDLQDYSREMKLEVTTTNPKRLLEESLTVFSVPGNVQISDETRDEPEMQVDAREIRRVFVNIIKNAVEAMPEGGRLEIKTNETEDLVEFTFTDTGTGISREILEKIGRPLYTTKARGMGFGLAICKRIVDAHRGKISVESTVGKGTTVRIVLPIMHKIEEDEKLLVGIVDSQASIAQAEPEFGDVL